MDEFWYDDVEQYIVITNGNSEAIQAAINYSLDWFSIDDMYHQTGHTDQLKIKKNAWLKHSSIDRMLINNYLNGFVDGFESAQES